MQEGGSITPTYHSDATPRPETACSAARADNPSETSTRLQTLPPSKGVPSGPWISASQYSRSSSETGPAVMPSGGLLVRARYSWRRRRCAVEVAIAVWWGWRIEERERKCRFVDLSGEEGSRNCERRRPSSENFPPSGGPMPRAVIESSKARHRFVLRRKSEMSYYNI